MNRKHTLLTALFFSIFLVSCGGDDAGDGGGSGSGTSNTITLSATSLSFDGNAGSQTVTITTNHEWAANVSEDWISINPTNSTNQNTTITVTVQKNGEYDGREGTITFMAGSARAYIAVSQAGGDGVPDPNAITCPIAGYKLVWNDEFDKGDQLNSNDWEWENQNAGWVNNELQNYRPGTQTIDGKHTTEIVKGNLQINCFKGTDGKIYSGRVNAKNGGKGWQYGYFEARMLLPKGKGTWPAYWMMPISVDWVNEGWPKCGEIDIMEEVGCVPNEVSSSLHAEGHNHTNNTQVTAARNIGTAESEYHVYAIEWTADYIKTYVDGQLLLSYNSDHTVRNFPYDKPFHLIFNLAWGGSWGGMNGVDESALPVTMKIDYIRVFQKK